MPEKITKISDDDLADDDLFLQTHIPGDSQSIVEMRMGISRINLPRNISMIRNVLLIGESGVGKNHIAKVIAGHRRWVEASLKNGSPEVSTDSLGIFACDLGEVHLPGLPDELAQSELFGHEEGAFTGANAEHPGYLRENYSDILLDEIGDASPSLQSKLLRVLDTGRFRPVGGSKDREVTSNARFIMATNKSLAQLVANNEFRDDLLWRIREFVLVVPPLRERTDAIDAIIESILLTTKNEGTPPLRGYPAMTAKDRKFAKSYHWPGNIRELKLAVKRWLLQDGEQTLRKIVQKIERELPNNPEVSIGDELMAKVIWSDLDRARIESRKLDDTVGEYAKKKYRAAKDAISKWERTTRPRPEEIVRMFPGHRDANTLRTIMRRWEIKPI